MDILLHICCGPCLIYPFAKLKDRGFNIRGFYYNPNLYPPDEYRRRVEALRMLTDESGLRVDYPQFRPADFSQAISGQENYPQRCRACWDLRLRQSAQAAKQGGFPVFSTTLLSSPYQDHELLKELGEQIGQETGVDFYYEDFRLGFKAAQAQAKQKGIYRQKYCGCKYSLELKPGKPGVANGALKT